jgi:uncharacterized protein (TIGR02611 family)
MKLWRKSAIALAGGLLVLLGVIMLVTPGPGWLAIAAGLAVLATEFEWAQRLLERVRKRIQRATHRKE